MKVKGICSITKPVLAICGEAPGREEAEEGVPFIGSAGTWQRNILYSVDLNPKSVYFFNAINCRPPNNDIKSFEAVEAMQRCAPGFRQELLDLLKRGVKMFVPVGTTALSRFSIEGGIMKNRGSIFVRYVDKKGEIWESSANRRTGETRQEIFIIPTYHPSFIMRGNIKEEPTWANDWRKIKRLVRDGYTPPKERFELAPTLSQLQSFTEIAVQKKLLLGCDVEASSLNPMRARLYVLSFAESGERAISVPFFGKGNLSYWSDTQLKQVRRCVQLIFDKCGMIFQNALYDYRVLAHNGFYVKNIAHDTLLLHHCLTGDTIIDTLKGKTPIRDLNGKEDFWVFSHNGKKIVPALARKCWSTGKRADLVRVVFWSKNRFGDEKPWIDCTPDHEFPVQGHSAKVRAIDLRPGDRLLPGQYNSDSVDHTRIANWVYNETHVTPKKKWNHIHHIDHDHSNNDPLNLKEVSIAEHNALHPENQKNATDHMVERRRAETLELDTEEIHKLYFEVGLSVREIAQHLSIKPTTIQRVFRTMGWKTRSHSQSNVLRWQKARNCRVLSVVPLRSTQEVFDIEVRETHCFSANGIIVGNSIHPELPHNLVYITSVYGKTPYWKDLVLDSEERMMEHDNEAFRRYNCRDSATLQQNIGPMLADLKSSGTQWIYNNISMPLIKPIAKIMDNGMGFDSGALTRCIATLRKSRERLERAIYRDYPIAPSLNLHSSQDLAFIFYRIKPNKYRTALKKLDEYETNPRKKKDSKAFRELSAIRDIFSSEPPFVLPRTMGRIPTTDTGLPATAEDDILSLQIAASNRLRDIALLRRLRPDHQQEKDSLTSLLQFIKDHRLLIQLDKVMSTYGSFPVEADGRVHFQFKIHGTATGRLSSGGKMKKAGYENQFPGNAQNIPKKGPGKILRKAFVADPGNVLVEFDYSNLELRVIGYLSKDQALIDIFATGLNIHSENCKILFQIDEKHPLWDIARRAAKVYIFGRNYGGSLQGVFRKVAKEVPELALTFDRFCEADSTYRKAHPMYAKWYDETVRSVEKTRTITNAFGRKRYLLGPQSSIAREGLNTPVQGTAADIVNQLALIELSEHLKPAWRMILTVHDSVMLEVPEKDLPEVLRVGKTVMQTPITVNGYEVAFPVDAAIGKNWYDMVGEKVWMTKNRKTARLSSATTAGSSSGSRRKSTKGS